MDHSNSESEDEQEVEHFSSSLKCLFCSDVYEKESCFFRHLASAHKMTSENVVKICKSQYDWIRLVNIQRKKSFSTTDELFGYIMANNKEAMNDSNLIPVMESDEALQIDFETVFEESSQDVEQKLSYEELAAKYEDLMSNFVKCKHLLKEMVDGKAANSEDDDDESLGNKLIPSQMEDRSYFESYSHHGIHRTMINDEVRTMSYHDFIIKNGEKLFKDKIVLDVGTGSGILSVFAVRAGAKHVYAIEASDIMFSHATETMIHQNLQDRVTVIHGKVENISLPDGVKVDVIISEWMGFLLLYECMLDSVLYAARKYLAPNGKIFPTNYTIEMIPIQCSEKLRHDEVDMWSGNKYNIQMPSMRKEALEEATVVDLTSHEDYSVKNLSNDASSLLTSIDLSDEKLVNNTKPFDLEPIDKEYPITCSGKLDGVLFYFDVDFDPKADHKVTFSTSPFAQSTHWKQVLVNLPTRLDVKTGDKLFINVHISRTEKYSRGLMIRLKYRINADGPLMTHECNFL